MGAKRHLSQSTGLDLCHGPIECGHGLFVQIVSRLNRGEGDGPVDDQAAICQFVDHELPMFTEELETVYGLLSDAEADVVDAVIIRLLDEHESAWARQNRVVGYRGSAWIIEFRHHRDSFHLYWRYLDDETVVLLVLRRVREESAGP